MEAQHQDRHLELVEAVAGVRPINAMEVAIHDLDLDSCPYQLRDSSDSQDLMESLKQFGQIVPVLIMPREGGYLILDGHGRAFAAKALGWGVVNAMLYPLLDQEEARRVASICNVQRRNLAPAELANTAQMLRKQSEKKGEKITSAEIAKILGLNSAKDVQRLMSVPEEVLRCVDGEVIRMAHAYVVAKHIKELGLVGESLEAEVEDAMNNIRLKKLTSAQLKSELSQMARQRGGKKKKCYCCLRDGSLHLSRVKLSGKSSAGDLERARAQLSEGVDHIDFLLGQLAGDE